MDLDAMLGEIKVRLEAEVHNYESWSSILQELIVRLNDVRRKQPKHHRAINLTAISWMELRRSDLALVYFKRAVRIKPSVQSLTNLAYFYLYEGKPYKENVWRWQPNEAIKLLEKAVCLKPLSHYPYSLLGEAYIIKNQNEKAVQVLRKSIDIEVAIENLNNLGVALLNTGRISEATSCFTNARNVFFSHDESFIPYVNYGMCLAKLGELKELEVVADALMDYVDYDGFYHEMTLADFYYECGNYEKMLDIYRSTKMSYSKDWVSQYYFALLERGDNAEARVLSERAIARTKDAIDELMENDEIPDHERSEYINDLLMDIKEYEKSFAEIETEGHKPRPCFTPDIIKKCYLFGCFRHDNPEYLL